MIKKLNKTNSENARAGKRFSKAKMKREVVLENNKTKKEIRKSAPKSEEKNTSKKAVSATEQLFSGNPVLVYHATLRKPSLQIKGYNVLSKGQLVRVEEFATNSQFSNVFPKLRITSDDGRVGVTEIENIKKLQFS